MKKICCVSTSNGGCKGVKIVWIFNMKLFSEATNRQLSKSGLKPKTGLLVFFLQNSDIWTLELPSEYFGTLVVVVVVEK